MQKMNSFKNPNFTYASPHIFKSIKNVESQQEEHDHRRNTRRRLLIIAISSALLLLLLAGAVLVPARAATKEQQSIKSICSVTLYQESCFSTIYSLKHTTKTSNPNPDSPNQIFILSLQVALNELITLNSSISERSSTSTADSKALRACSRQIQDSVDHVNMSVISLQPDNVHQFQQHWAADIRTWLSTAITDQTTCLNGLAEFADDVSLSIQREITASMVNATVFTSNSLAIVSKIPAVVRGSPISVHKRLLKENETSLRPDLTVAKDGSGDYETIAEAVKAMPKKSKRRFFIYVKQGEYKENVLVDKDSWNLMMYGDGMEKTVVSSNLNYVDGVGAYDSGTLIADGGGFIARDMGFRNTAGPEKFQAVAVRSSSDRSIFYRCHIDGYQDTLYVHSNRQFYRECVVTGTIDFIFGNAAAVFQNCSIQAKQPMKGQYNTITAQSKSDPNQNTGFSIQRCSISPRGNLTARTYFGRPWNVYSTAVVLKTEIQGIIDPEGWSAWEPGAKAPDSIFYAEYKNDGPGSALSGRVTWPGYKPGITDEEAEKFSVQEFIQGQEWLEGLNIGYDPHI